MSVARPELRIGRVTKAHGVKGAVRIELLTDFPERFAPGSRVEVGERSMVVASSEDRDAGLIVRFDGVEDRNAAEQLVGVYCTLPLTAAKPLPADRFYHFQLVGLLVFDLRRQREVGRVADVLSYAANDVLQVVEGKREVLIPMVKTIVHSIDPAAGRITVELPEETEA